MTLTRRFQNPLELGPVSAICATTHWVLVGTITGALSLWDLRFGLLLKSWSARGGITSLQLHPNRGRGRWVIASINRGDPSDNLPIFETWDVETGSLVETFESRTTRPTPRAPPTAGDVLSTKSELIAELAGAGGLPNMTNEPDVPSVQVLLVGGAFSPTQPIAAEPTEASPPGWVASAGNDRIIRYWDLARGDGFIVCGSQKDKDVAFRQLPGPPAIYYTLPARSKAGSTGPHAASQRRQPLRPHYDAICALATVETPFSTCIVSADRSGVIKVWRLEGQVSRT